MLDCTAQWRLCNPEAFRGATEMQFLCNGEERSGLVQVDDTLLSARWLGARARARDFNDALVDCECMDATRVLMSYAL